MTESRSTTPELVLTARLNTSAADARRGVVRLHPEVLAALGLREWDAVSLIGSRRTAAVVAAAPDGSPQGTALLDDVTLSNTGLRENASVAVGPVTVYGARTVAVTGSALATGSISDATLRQALLGKVLTVGDTVSLLPRDLGPGTSTTSATQALSRTFGVAWTTELLTVSAVDPSGGPVSVQPNSAVGWGSGTVTAAQPQAASRPTPKSAAPPVSVADLVGVSVQQSKLTEWLRLALDESELLATLGASPHLGVLITGPGGVGKATLARAVIGERACVVLDGPSIGALEASARVDRVTAAVDELAGSGVLLITDVDALLPSVPEPASTFVLDVLRRAVDTPGLALIATTAHPEATDPRLRGQDLCDRELTITLPDASGRKGLLEHLLRKVPQGDVDLTEIASRTPGFVVADLAALTREAALRAAARASNDSAAASLTQDDLVGALQVIRPLSRSGSEELAIGSLTLDDVGDMVETKQALTEAVLWPLRHPDSFARLGIEPPRGVLLYGPPGCGKTFLVRALASSGQLSVHSVKGAELMDKWVGSSEKAVRELFQRARDSAPSLIFLDEVDALVPRRGQSSDSGVGDRVVAALLTELDGVEPLRDVVVLGATNRPDLIDPALLRPGRLERLVFVPPPDSDARVDILKASGKSIPLAEDVDLESLARDLDGYSAADCAALLREAALTAMRRSMDAADVTAADVATARATVKPSLDPEQVAHLRAYGS
ncbi:ATPase [Rhodococcus sp. 05-2255-3B1]|uniref:AAA family ATPase n=1 Tax=unclassified Rhodococcus (in: high G+C Gram-positive bacteria) TaxID=192944 RepID=UPI000B9C63F9|nr:MULTISPECIES: AAA family ATPase [unclassified Rhodococcus (in: high G+C Gram-positive bacteria)]OZE08241.1 ATPase [Rhodococcus sp. 05-2255-3B1]OZE15280.1 ATPase [Rhodococcus sp. 05-2255-3C]OZE23073.1 ATPase [Rhodococcus sp. 05-2255-2A2]